MASLRAVRGVLRPPPPSGVLRPPKLRGVLRPPKLCGVHCPPKLRGVHRPPKLHRVLLCHKISKNLNPFNLIFYLIFTLFLFDSSTAMPVKG